MPKVVKGKRVHSKALRSNPYASSKPSEGMMDVEGEATDDKVGIKLHNATVSSQMTHL